MEVEGISGRLPEEGILELIPELTATDWAKGMSRAFRGTPKPWGAGSVPKHQGNRCDGAP